ncbi:class I SAM-dependent methyltransferase [Dyadobacter sandarakinus]|uniref:Class I SAM-dependent methyltransferase n=1 Tax=Dyadobacter sandarakinus TaxID=2747268 RepID=A0ABX7I4Y6_9BACT|nr:class I SAM-dependent methyltransferase [Dyadobacter sandarakinus]QRR00923.1 class I SAM-dependent methyltransferase [Dyadobacter sandarakinus]
MGIKTYIRNNFLADIKPYTPRFLQEPNQSLDIVSAWKGLELIIPDIMKRFNLKNDKCIEFGVEFGFSTVVFANYFSSVIGVDTFEGDQHTANKSEHYEQTSQRLAPYSNIRLIKSDYRDWIHTDHTRYDLAHVDIVHHYDETYECGLWAAQHSSCTLFHDTESFPEVRRAVKDIARTTRQKLYNYPLHYGLGILVDR